MRPINAVGSGKGPTFVRLEQQLHEDCRSPRRRCGSGSPARSRGLRRWRPAGCWRSAAESALLLQHLAPICEVYRGTDLSPTAIAELAVLARDAERNADTSSWRNGMRRISEDWKRRSVDTVILNSVVQYFPDFNYFCEVLEKARRAGDVGRSRCSSATFGIFGLLPVFHTSVQLAQAAPRLEHASS